MSREAGIACALSTKMASNTLRELLEAKEFIAAPGVFDMVSAKLADLTEAKALYMTGFGTSITRLGELA